MGSTGGVSASHSYVSVLSIRRAAAYVLQSCDLVYSQDFLDSCLFTRRVMTLGFYVCGFISSVYVISANDFFFHSFSLLKGVCYAYHGLDNVSVSAIALLGRGFGAITFKMPAESTSNSSVIPGRPTFLSPLLATLL